MGHWVALETQGGTISAWRAEPTIPPRGGLVVVQEIFGVNAHIRAVVDGFAAHGFSTIAPALFDRFECHVELGYDVGCDRRADYNAAVSSQALQRTLALLETHLP